MVRPWAASPVLGSCGRGLGTLGSLWLIGILASHAHVRGCAGQKAGGCCWEVPTPRGVSGAQFPTAHGWLPKSSTSEGRSGTRGLASVAPGLLEPARRLSRFFRSEGRTGLTGLVAPGTRRWANRPALPSCLCGVPGPPGRGPSSSGSLPWGGAPSRRNLVREHAGTSLL